MRGGTRRRHAEGEEESAFVSMTDMTVSFLFIVMVLLAFFASQFDDQQDQVPKEWLDETVRQRDAAGFERDEAITALEEARIALDQVRIERDAARYEAEDLRARLDAAETRAARVEEKVASLTNDNRLLQSQLDCADAEIVTLKAEIERLTERLRRLEVRDPLEAYISRSARARRVILEQLRDNLKLAFPDLTIVISEESDALRFQGDGLFDRGQSVLRSDKQAIVDVVAARLEQILPCYTLGARSNWTETCNPGLAIIEALQIEGHTDSDGSDIGNLYLSTARANATFVAMTEREPDLVEHLNIRAEPVISVAGYGEMRPVAANDVAANKATNRRIDLRIIMYVPRRSEEIDRIRARLMDRISEMPADADVE
jgi:outer membrane protein OmpA-like peptidoglycan-associated protein